MATQRQHTQALTIESWPVEKVIPYARNARQIPEAAIAKVAASIAEFGWRQPRVVDEAGVILAGHPRLLAAQRLQLAEVPVRVAVGLSPAAAKAYRLLDNRSHQESTWDEELLGIELEELAGMDLDLALTGFDDDELQRLLAPPPTDGLIDRDEAPEPPESPVSRSGCERPSTGSTARSTRATSPGRVSSTIWKSTGVDDAGCLKRIVGCEVRGP